MSEKSQEFPQSGQLVGHLLVQMASSNESEIFTVMLDKSMGGYKGSISGFIRGRGVYEKNWLFKNFDPVPPRRY